MDGMKKILALLLISLIIPVSFSGCMERKEEGIIIARSFWIEAYEPVVNLSDLGAGGLPSVDISYVKSKEMGIGDQIFVYYQIYMENVEDFRGKAYCIVDGKELVAFDVDKEYLPVPPQNASLLGLPQAIPDEKIFSQGEVHTFVWPFKFSHFGNYTFHFYIEGADGMKYGEIERNFNFAYLPTEDNRWALIITVDPAENEIASWKDGAIVLDLLFHRYNFPRKNIVYLSNKCATRENVKDAMKWISQHTNNDSKLVFWFSGHGGLEINGDDDRELIDGRLTLWKDYLYDGDVASFFANSRSSNILSVVDACYSGEFGGPEDIEAIFGGLGSQKRIEEEGRFLFTSATTFTRSKATENGGVATLLMAGALQGIHDRMGRSADMFPYGNNDGKISVEEAAWWAAFHCYIPPFYGFPEINDCYPGELYLEP
ncbi:MAG: hypothetical protein FE048_05595 [Thermoplasmata archaeon]|nr:MAG: hypothetical protein FE048_05595 [Thermoplasmata archaeon]